MGGEAGRMFELNAIESNGHDPTLKRPGGPDELEVLALSEFDTAPHQKTLDSKIGQEDFFEDDPDVGINSVWSYLQQIGRVALLTYEQEGN